MHGVVLSCLEFTVVLESVCLCIVLFPAIIIYFLWAHFLYPLLLELSDKNVRSFIIVPQITEASFIFIFQSIFSLLFRVGNFNHSIIQFTDYFLCPLPFCCWTYLLNFYFNYCNFTFKIFNWFFFISSIFFCWNFLSSSFF